MRTSLTLRDDRWHPAAENPTPRSTEALKLGNAAHDTLGMKLPLLSLAIASLLLAGCAVTPAAPVPPEVLSADRASANAIAITQHEFRFDAAQDSVRQGVVDFAITNQGNEHHEFVIVPYDDGRFGEPVAEHEALEPG